MTTTCPWAGNDLLAKYHDAEWGVPVYDDRVLFEFLILEGAQAGLSWETILKKRDRYREVYAGFDPAKVARFTDAKNAKLLEDPGIVRNRLKVAAAVRNAKAFLKIQDELGSFDRYLWAFVDGRPVVNSPRTLKDLPAKTPLSDRISKDLQKRDFTFVGSTIIYAFLQAVGVVNDHIIGCPRREAIIGRYASAAAAT